MIKHLMFVLALSACTKASTANETPTNTDRGAAPKTKATVTLTAVTFADDCGGTAPHSPPLQTASATAPAEAPARAAPAQDSIAARRRCEQTSMQLAVAAASDTQVHIKSVEVFDESGKALGTLTASKPTRWMDGPAAYEAWDEKVVAGQTTRASYVLSQPAFINRWDERDRTYTVKVVASVGGVDQPLQTTVMIVAQPPAVPT